MLELYHLLPSTCSQKVRLCLEEKGLRYTSHILDAAVKREHLSEAYLRLNPNGVVPTLVDDGIPIIESSVICEYLDETRPEVHLSPTEPVERAKMRAWMRWLEEYPATAIRPLSLQRMFEAGTVIAKHRREDWGAFVDKLVTHKQLYKKIGESGFPEEVIADSLATMSRLASRADSSLRSTHWLAGADFSLADIVLIPLMVRLYDMGLAGLWSSYPRVGEWFEEIQLRPSFGSAFPSGSRFSELGTARSGWDIDPSSSSGDR